MNEGKSWIHARPPLRYRCTVCHKTGSERAGAPFYRRPPAEAIITLVVTPVAHGCPIAAIVAACGFPRQTVAEWTDAAGVQCAAVDQPGGLPSARPRCGTGGREPGHASVGIVWVALTMPSRDPTLARTLARWGGQPTSQPRPTGESGAPDAGRGPDRDARGVGGYPLGRVAGGNRRQLLPAAPQFGAEAHPGDGGGDHGSRLAQG